MLQSTIIYFKKNYMVKGSYSQTSFEWPWLIRRYRCFLHPYQMAEVYVKPEGQRISCFSKILNNLGTRRTIVAVYCFKSLQIQSESITLPQCSKSKLYYENFLVPANAASRRMACSCLDTELSGYHCYPSQNLHLLCEQG